MMVVTRVPPSAESRVMMPSAAMAPAKTVDLACFMAMMAAMKKVLSPNSETMITDMEATKAWTNAWLTDKLCKKASSSGDWPGLATAPDATEAPAFGGGGEAGLAGESAAAAPPGGMAPTGCCGSGTASAPPLSLIPAAASSAQQTKDKQERKITTRITREMEKTGVEEEEEDRRKIFNLLRVLMSLLGDDNEHGRGAL